MAYIDYISEVMGVIPRIPPAYVPILLNRAWGNIRDMRLWSFLLGYGDLVAPTGITAGNATSTFGSVTVTVDATAATAINAVALPPVPSAPVSSPQLGVGRQFRMQNVNTGGPYYNIIAWDGVNTLTLDRPFADTTVSGPYAIAKVYYTPPQSIPDFVRYLTITNKGTGYSIKGKRLLYSQGHLNSVDPQRAATGDAYIVATYFPDSNGNMVHEFYPGPTNQSLYTCLFQRKGLPLSPTVDLPNTLDPSLLIYRTLMLAADWALANVATYPEFAQTNWVQYRMQQEKLFNETRIQCIKQDDELMPQLPTFSGSEFDFPLGGQFLQSHDVSSILGGR